MDADKQGSNDWYQPPPPTLPPAPGAVPSPGTPPGTPPEPEASTGPVSSPVTEHLPGPGTPPAVSSPPAPGTTPGPGTPPGPGAPWGSAARASTSNAALPPFKKPTLLSRLGEGAAILVRLGLLLVLIGVITVLRTGTSAFERPWNYLRGRVGIEQMEPGQCFVMTDGPIRGSGTAGATDDEIDASWDDDVPESAYPKIDCADWAKQDHPWQVYRVHNVGYGGIDYDGCDDVWLSSKVQDGNVTKTLGVCLENLEYLDDDASIGDGGAAADA